MIKYIDKNIPRYKPPKNAKGGKGKGGPSKGTTVRASRHSNLIILVLAGKHNLNDATTAATDGRVGGGAEEKVDLLEGDLCQIQH